MAIRISFNKNIVSSDEIRNRGEAKPSLFMIGGNTCVTDERTVRQELVGRSILGAKAYNINIFSIGYENEILLRRGVNNLVFQEVDPLFQDIFLPIVFNEAGEQKTAEDIKKGLRNTMFFAHCAGTLLVNKIIDNLSFVLSEMKFNSDEVEKLLSEVFVLTYSPYTEIRDNATSLNLCPFYEPIGEMHWNDELENLSYEALETIVPPNLLDAYYKSEIPGPFVKEIIDNDKVAYAQNKTKTVVVLDALTDTAKNDMDFNDHSIVSLVYAPAHKETNPQTYHFAREVRDTVADIISKAHKTQDKRKMISDELDSLKAKVSASAPSGLGE